MSFDFDAVDVCDLYDCERCVRLRWLTTSRTHALHHTNLGPDPEPSLRARRDVYLAIVADIEADIIEVSARLCRSSVLQLGAVASRLDDVVQLVRSTWTDEEAWEQETIKLAWLAATWCEDAARSLRLLHSAVDVELLAEDAS